MPRAFKPPFRDHHDLYDFIATRLSSSTSSISPTAGGDRASHPTPGCGSAESFFRNLSDESRWNRFHRALHELPLNLLNQFTNVDYDTHLALLAEVFVDGSEVILGESRYVRGEDPTCAEFAVTVDDRWQGKGLGRLLLSLLEGRAAAEGIEMLFGRTLPGNVRMQALARKAGFEIVPDSNEPGTLRLEKRLGLPCARTLCESLPKLERVVRPWSPAESRERMSDARMPCIRAALPIEFVVARGFGTAWQQKTGASLGGIVHD